MMENGIAIYQEENQATELSEFEAKGLISRIRSFLGRVEYETGSLRREVYRLWKGKGWSVLQYNSWTQCVKEEFEDSQPEIVRQLSAARIELILCENGLTGEKTDTNWYQVVGKIPEFKVRALSKFLGRKVGNKTTQDLPEELCEAYKMAYEIAGGDPGGREVRDAVNIISPPSPPKTKKTTVQDKNAVVPKNNGASRPGLDGPALAPKQGEVRSTGNWEAFLRGLNNQSLWVRESGGISGYTQGWTESHIVYIRENLIRFSEEFARWAQELSGVSS